MNKKQRRSRDLTSTKATNSQIFIPEKKTTVKSLIELRRTQKDEDNFKANMRYFKFTEARKPSQARLEKVWLFLFDLNYFHIQGCVRPLRC
jgi:hypothetical protein